MAFFRTRDRQGDRSIGDNARQRRLQQLQTQQQLQAAQKAIGTPEQLAPAGFAE